MRNILQYRWTERQLLLFARPALCWQVLWQPSPDKLASRSGQESRGRAVLNVNRRTGFPTARSAQAVVVRTATPGNFFCILTSLNFHNRQKSVFYWSPETQMPNSKPPGTYDKVQSLTVHNGLKLERYRNFVVINKKPLDLPDDWMRLRIRQTPWNWSASTERLNHRVSSHTPATQLFKISFKKCRNACSLISKPTLANTSEERRSSNKTDIGKNNALNKPLLLRLLA